jgi:hypothetical protein
MSDECGASTADGSACELPGSYPDGRCYHHTDEANTDSGGRPTKFTDDRAERAKDAAREGMSKAGCARAAGVGKATLERWLNERDKFRNAFTRARHEGEQKLVTGPLIDDPDDPVDIDGQHARFLLSTSFDYVKTEKQEVEHSGGIDTEVDIGDDSREAIREALASRYE